MKAYFTFRSIAALAAFIGSLGAHEALAAGICRFPPVKPVYLKNMGPCGFDLQTLSFAGDATQQGLCLLTPVLTGGKLGPQRETLPKAFASRLQRNADLPTPASILALLRERGLEQTFAPALSQPVAHAHDGDPFSRSATYFVIHDTSAPNYMNKPWPGDIDTRPTINRLENYSCANKIERAHVFINRSGAILLAHDFSVPWRSTKFEMAVEFGSALKGLFLHVELIQPRRRAPEFGRRNDFQAPVPGFTPAQYDALAAVYVVASARAGFWLIPGFHAVIDEGIYDKHDDPQNFELAAFIDSVERILMPPNGAAGPAASAGASGTK